MTPAVLSWAPWDGIRRRLSNAEGLPMTRVLLIGFAGALGTLARYGVGLWAGRTLGTGFPYGTLIVNIVGCFLIALVVQLATTTALVSPTVRVILTTGFIGGLTTYSSFNFETTYLLRERTWVAGLGNLGITLVACFVAGVLGLALGNRIAAP
jgi:CrcB protein